MHQRYLGGSHSDYESINGNLNVGGWADPGVPYDGDGSAWARVHKLRDNYKAVKTWVDVPQYIDFIYSGFLADARMSTGVSGPSLREAASSSTSTTPMGSFNLLPTHGTGNPHTGPLSVPQAGRQAGDGPGSLFSTLFAGGDPDYRVLLADRIYKAYFNEGALTPARTAAPLNVRCDELEAVFVAEAARWGYRTPADWLAVREDVSSRWLPTRTEVVLGELRAAGLYPGLDAALLNQLGGVVRAGFEVFFTDPPKGDIFFTIDGSDPRLPGGVLAPAARRYAAGALPIRPGSPLLSSIATRPVIDRNTVLKVRACEGKQWSALNETYFQTDGGALKPGEITIMELN